MSKIFIRLPCAIILSIIIILNCLFISLCLFSLALTEFLLPKASWKKRIHDITRKVPYLWSDINAIGMRLLIPTKIDIQGMPALDKNSWYFLVSNHQSWLDILIITSAFSHTAPTFCFFMKEELKWQLPVAAQACQILDFPFMKRYTKEFLKKNPHLKGKDIEETRKTCEKFKTIPVMMVNFVEGGRFTKEKHERQNSPYQYLLKPKAGGVAFAMTTMGQYFESIINVTIVYSENDINIFDYLMGKVKKITVVVDVIPVDDELRGDYENDSQYRVKFQRRLNQIWEEKDALIGKVKSSLN